MEVFMRAGLSIALVLASVSICSPGQAADADHGAVLAKRWCAACHIVAADQTSGQDHPPPFATIAKMPNLSAETLAQFLMDPHPRMPDMQLSRQEASDLAAYIMSQGQ
jgi:mono/diheme cytochrome c family protein